MTETRFASELLLLLEAQTGICDEMISLAQREQQALTRVSPGHLPAILAAQSACTERLARNQAHLEATLRNGSEVTDDADGSPSALASVLAHVPPEVRARLTTLRDGLEERAYTLAVLNAQNALLVRSGLLQIDQAAATLAHALGETRSYGAAGAARIPTMDNTITLDRQV